MRLRHSVIALSLLFGACHLNPRDMNHDGYVDCQEDPLPDPVTDIPCGFRDGVPVN